MAAYTYLYRGAYGSPEVDRVSPVVEVAGVSADGLTIDLSVQPLTQGHVHELSVAGLRSRAGRAVLHPTGYYTLNEIPAGQ
jgi:hypothetical protein